VASVMAMQAPRLTTIVRRHMAWMQAVEAQTHKVHRNRPTCLQTGRRLGVAKGLVYGSAYDE
jgi:hypothetical protein